MEPIKLPHLEWAHWVARYMRQEQERGMNWTAYRTWEKKGPPSDVDFYCNLYFFQSKSDAESHVMLYHNIEMAPISEVLAYLEKVELSLKAKKGESQQLEIPLGKKLKKEGIMNLEDPKVAKWSYDYLKQMKGHGVNWAVYNPEIKITNEYDFTLFMRQRDAHAFLDYGEVDPSHLKVESIRNILPKLEEIIENNHIGNKSQKKEDIMNLDNLNEHKDNLEQLKFDPAVIEKLDENVKKGIPAFDLTDQYLGDEGRKAVIDVNVPVRQSSNSENYYMDRYELTMSRAEPLPENQKYFVISEGEKGKALFRSFDSPAKAIQYLNEKEGTRELARGTGPSSEESKLLVRKENDKVVFTDKDFRETYFSKPITQTFYVNEGQGFTLPQALNLMQGRSVYKDNLLDREGQTYSAYVSIDRDSPVTNGFRYNQYRDPEYGFDIRETIKKYDIADANTEAKLEKLVGKLQNGDRVPVLAEKNDQKHKVAIEVSPRYKNINFYNPKGVSLGREFFDKNNKELKNPIPLRKNWDMSQKQGMRL